MANPKPSGCLAAIFGIFNRAAPAAEPQAVPTSAPATAALPYRRAFYLLSKAERSFFGVLEQAISGEYRIFAKVRLCDVLYLPKCEGRQGHLNRITSKHVDFVLCSRDEVKPMLVIELDDSSHEREDRKDRDGFVDAALKAAGLPLLRVSCKTGYNVADLQNRIRGALAAPTA